LSVFNRSVVNPNDSFDLLNGGLDEDNFVIGDAEDVIPTWAVQPGSFVAGYYYGFHRRDIVLAEQQVTSAPGFDIPTNNFGYGVIGSFSHKVFLPFDAEVVYFSFQAWCKQNCLFYTGVDAVEGGAGDFEEEFVMVPYINGIAKDAHASSLPNYTHSEDDVGADLLWNAPSGGGDDTLKKWEYRWRYVTSSGFYQSTASTQTDDAVAGKGFLTFDLFVYGNIQAPNPLPGSLTIDSGGLTLIAIR
jgi:hypothetical protein